MEKNEIKTNNFSEAEMLAKQNKMGHLLNYDDEGKNDNE